MNERQVWRVVGVVAGVAAGAATRKAMTAGWKHFAHDEPPSNPASPRTSWSAAITWSVATGVALAVSRLLAQRGAAEAWKTATGDYPEGLDEVRP
jgi:hypothetical protein